MNSSKGGGFFSRVLSRATKKSTSDLSPPGSTSDTSKQQLEELHSLIKRVEDNDPNTTEVKLGGLSPSIATPEVIEGLCGAILENRYVTSVEFSHVALSSTTAIPLCAMMTGNFSVQRLTLAYASVNDDTFRRLVGVLTGNRCVTHLSLEGNHLEDGTTVGTLLQHNQTLQSLDLSYNNFAANVLEIWPQLAFNASLTALNLNCNSIPDEACKQLLTVLQENVVLSTVELRDNPAIEGSTLSALKVRLIEGRSRVKRYYVATKESSTATEPTKNYEPMYWALMKEVENLKSQHAREIGKVRAQLAKAEDSLLKVEQQLVLANKKAQAAEAQAALAENNLHKVEQQLVQASQKAQAREALPQSPPSSESEGEDPQGVEHPLPPTTAENLSAPGSERSSQREEIVVRTYNVYTPVTGVSMVKKSDWMNDDAAVRCGLCEHKFTVTRRRHHCRLCGKIFCGKCCTVSKLHDKKRVCHSCVVQGTVVL